MKKVPKRSVAKKRQGARVASVKKAAQPATAKKVVPPQNSARREKQDDLFILKKERDEALAREAALSKENARLLTELRERTGELTESLDRQTATSELLDIISSSPSDLKPVFDAMLANAVRLCNAQHGHMSLYEGGAYQLVAVFGHPPDYADVLRRAVRNPGPETALARVALERQPVQLKIGSRPIEDWTDPLHVETAQLLKSRGIEPSSVLGVPMLKSAELVGTIVVSRHDATVFTDKQVQLVENFAAQAVIAIENARLLTELRTVWTGRPLRPRCWV